MGTMADQLANLHNTVYSPDGLITAELRSDQVTSLTFQEGAFRQYTERELERQLSRLALRMWTSYQRSYDEAVAAATGQAVEPSKESWDANRRRFRKAQAETVSTGMSPRRLVYFECTGMVSWQIVIRDGALTELDEAQLVAEVFGAYRAMNLDYRIKMQDLRTEHYGDGFAPRRT